MPEKFEVGDVVQLKSGGPKFTVTFVDPKTGEVSLMGFPNKIDPQTWGPVPMGVLRRISENPEIFKEGDVVQLKSGGPKFVVAGSTSRRVDLIGSSDTGGVRIVEDPVTHSVLRLADPNESSD